MEKRDDQSEKSMNNSACCLSVLVSSACSRFGSETTAETVDVVFDAPIEEIIGSTTAFEECRTRLSEALRAPNKWLESRKKDQLRAVLDFAEKLM